jgi:hypothetical protein
MMNAFPHSITTVGIEIEGFWARSTDWTDDIDPDPDCYDCSYNEDGDCTYRCDDCSRGSEDKYLESLGLKEDGSVTSYAREACGSNDYVGGEYASPVLSEWNALTRLISDCGTNGAGYPPIVSAHTGMHIHLGVTRHLYDFTLSEVYWSLIKRDLFDLVDSGKLPVQDAKWLDYRLRFGRSSDDVTSYCQPNSWERIWERYTHVNYSSYSSYGTIEIRACPAATTPASALLMIEQVLRSTHNYWTNPSLWEQVSSEVRQPQDITLTNLGPVINKEVTDNRFNHIVTSEGYPTGNVEVLPVEEDDNSIESIVDILTLDGRDR